MERVFFMSDYEDDPDWLYFLARDIEDKREQLIIDLHPRFSISPVILYRGMPKTRELKKRTNTPVLPHANYFKLIGLLLKDPQKYQGHEGYIEAARDLRKEVETAVHLGNVYTAAKEYRSGLNWSGKIDMPLEHFDIFQGMLERDLERDVGSRLYQGMNGYIRAAMDLRERTESAANLGHIWLAARDYRGPDMLDWSGVIDMRLDDVVFLRGMLERDLERDVGSRLYQGMNGYIRAAMDLRERTESAANLGHIWSAVRDYVGPDKLDWSSVINMPLDDVVLLRGMLERDLERDVSSRLYHGDVGYVQAARDLRKKTKSAANLGKVWSAARDYRGPDKLDWSGVINMPLDDVVLLRGMLERDLERDVGSRLYQGMNGYIRAAMDLREKTGSAANLGQVWSAVRDYVGPDKLNWSYKNSPLFQSEAVL